MEIDSSFDFVVFLSCPEGRTSRGVCGNEVQLPVPGVTVHTLKHKHSLHTFTVLQQLVQFHQVQPYCTSHCIVLQPTSLYSSVQTRLHLHPHLQQTVPAQQLTPHKRTVRPRRDSQTRSGCALYQRCHISGFNPARRAGTDRSIYEGEESASGHHLSFGNGSPP